MRYIGGPRISLPGKLNLIKIVEVYARNEGDIVNSIMELTMDKETQYSMYLDYHPPPKNPPKSSSLIPQFFKIKINRK